MSNLFEKVKEFFKESSNLKYILHAVILIGLVLAGFKYLNGEEILEALRNFNYAYAPWMLLLSTIYLLMKAYRFVILMRPVSDVSWSVLMRGYVAGTAATLVPGGIAARAGLMQQAGVPLTKSSAPVAFSSIIDQAVFVVGALIAALFFPPARMPALIVLAIVIVGAAIFLIPASRRWLSNLAQKGAHKLDKLDEWCQFMDAMQDVFTWKVMLISFAITILALLPLIVLLDLCLRGVGLNVAYPQLFLAYILPTMLGRLSALPAGLGVTEASMVGFLVSTAGVNENTTTAAVAIFRIASIFFQALLGGVVYFLFWKGEKEGDAPVSSTERAA